MFMEIMVLRSSYDAMSVTQRVAKCSTDLFSADPL